MSMAGESPSNGPLSIPIEPESVSIPHSVASHKLRPLRIGLLGLGLEAYWSQFAGLRERLEGYIEDVQARISAHDRQVCNFGLLDSAEKSMDIAHQSRAADIDLLLVYVTTYTLSAVLLPVLRRNKVPVILLNLQPAAALDYASFNQMDDRVAMTGEWLAYCSACPVPEITNMMRRLGQPFQQVTGTLSPQSAAWLELEGWLRAAAVVHSLEHSRLGLMGHYYSGMLDIATDLLQVSGRFGIVLVMIEVDELSGLKEEVGVPRLAAKLTEFRSAFDVDPACEEAELQRAAVTAVALDKLVVNHELHMLAYYHKGVGVPANLDTMSSLILGTSLLTARSIAVAGEYEVKNVIAMKVLDLLGAGGSFTEYYAMDFDKNLVLMGHDGPGHPGIAEGRLKVRPLRVYHGKVGAGLSIEMSVRHGAVTLLSIIEDRDHGFGFLVAQGESVPGDVLRIGNTNSFYRFSIGAVAFSERWNAHGPAHHCAIGTGHLAGQLEKIAILLGMPFHQVC